MQAGRAVRERRVAAGSTSSRPSRPRRLSRPSSGPSGPQGGSHRAPGSGRARRRRPARAARALALLGAALLAWAGPASVARTEERGPLRVFAAASLADVVHGLGALQSDIRVEPSFGGSSTLARQIRDGAPADVFLSASPEWVAFLREAGAVAGETVVFARNRLVAVAPRGSSLARGGVEGPRALLARLAPEDRVAIAVEGVPAGEYARAALAALGLAEAFAPRLVGQKDVRAALHAVELGELPAGFVYASDAKNAAVEVLFRFDPATHPPIEYRAARVAGAPHPEAARRFLDALRGEAARQLLAAAGFERP